MVSPVGNGGNSLLFGFRRLASASSACSLHKDLQTIDVISERNFELGIALNFFLNTLPSTNYRVRTPLAGGWISVGTLQERRILVF
jgi:hypothetical protein